MKSNMGNTDRLIRIVVSVVFGALYYSGTVTGTLGIVLLALGAIFLVTALLKWCPIYHVLGLSTCPSNDK